MILDTRAQSRRRLLGSAALLTGYSLFPQRGQGRQCPDPFECLPNSAWQNARSNGLVMIHHPAPADLSPRAQIIPDGEPGRPLIVHGRVFAVDGRTPASGVTVYAYNTDSAGYYGSHQKEYPPRLFGWMKTNAAGEFQLHTIYPGHYPGMHVPAHVHFTLWSDEYPPQWFEELRFAGDPYLTPDMRAEEVTVAKNGVLHCRYNIGLSRETNFR